MLITNTNKKPLPIGESRFDRLIEDGFYYVDKTLFIKELMDMRDVVTLYTRPRRFGKTLSQTMLKCFFEDTAPIGGKDTRALFRGLKIEAAGERYMAHQGKYPVIYLTFKDTRADTLEDALNKLKKCIAQEFERHAYVLEKIPDDYNRNIFKELSECAGSVVDNQESLRFLGNYLEKYHGKRPIILIDEYDVPLENAWSRGFFREVVNFIRDLFSVALKDNSYMEFAVMTGCLRVSKESIFTGLNNLAVYSVFTRDFAEHFGFTQNEVDAMLKYYDMEDNAQIVREWYNGYVFGDTEIYNPWSCLKVVRSWIVDKNINPQPYWVNTSGNNIIRDMIDKMGFKIRPDLETLMAGGTVSALVHEDVTFDGVYSDTDNIWNFLFFTGYLKKKNVEKKSVDYLGRVILDLEIPNRELRIIFDEKIKEWFNESIKAKDLSVFFNAVLSGEAETFQKELSELLAGSISFMDSAENFYHGFMVGVLSWLEGYEVKSNRESGNGRSDLVLYSANGVDNKAVIFEFKLAKEFGELPEACEKAIKQIEENNYAGDWGKKGYTDIIKYGIGFHRKRCMVRKGN